MSEPSSSIPRTALDREIDSLRRMILELGNEVLTAIDNALQALRARDRDLARFIIENDARLNEMKFDVERTSHAILATQQPTARDLRAILCTLNIAEELERMGDHSAGIAKTILRMEGNVVPSLPRGLVNMVDIVRDMLDKVLAAYVEHDVDRAYVVASQDDWVDSQYRVLFEELLNAMADEPESLDTMLYLLFSGHNLERIGDRVTNIAEQTIFAERGEIYELNT